MASFMVVRGQHRWSFTQDCTYAIFDVFHSDADGSALESEMRAYATEKFVTCDGWKDDGDGLITYYKNLAFPGKPAIVGTTEFVVERGLGGTWYGFIRQEDITRLFDLDSREC